MQRDWDQASDAATNTVLLFAFPSQQEAEVQPQSLSILSVVKCVAGIHQPSVVDIKTSSVWDLTLNNSF